MPSQWTVRFSILAALLAFNAARPATAELKDLLARMPGDANALVVIDVERILKSPMAIREGWKEKQASGYGNKPVLVPPGATRVVLAALIDPMTWEPIWEVAVMDLDRAPSIESIARAEGGYTDTVGEKAAAWSPIGAYFVQLDAKVLGTVCPANRQFVSRWARQKQTLQGYFASMYLRNAAAAVDAGTEFVLAIDLEDVTNPQRVRNRLEKEPFDSLAGKKVDFKALSELIASMKGMTLRVEIGEQATGKCTVDFGKDTAMLADFGKPLLIETLGRFGTGLEDFDGWQVTAKGKTLTLEGKLSPAGLRRLFSVIEPPTPLEDAPAAAATPGAKPGVEGEPKAPQPPAAVVASQQYYKAVDEILINLQKQIGTGSKSASLAQSANWLHRDARRIARLPILNVDADLLVWGTDVADKLTEAAAIYSVGSTHTLARTNAVHDLDYSGGDWYSDSARTDFENVEKQRREAAARQKAESQEAAMEILKQLGASRAKVRAMLVDRYKVEF